MSNVELFDVPNISFPECHDFRSYLVQNYDPNSVNHELSIIVGLTKYESTEELISSLNSFGFKVLRNLGKAYHLVFESDDPSSEENLECYLTHDVDTDVLIFYTNFRKTKSDEIPKIQDFLKSDVNSYYLFFKPMLMKEISDELMDFYDNLQIHEFSARRDLDSRFEARVRPDFKRSLSYWGVDGRETLKEFEYQYGVLPTKFVVYIPEQAKFKIDEKGIFTFSSGNLQILFSILGKAVDESRKTIEAFNGSSFKVLSIQTNNKKFNVPSSTPVSINLHNPLKFYEVPHVKKLLVDAKYTLLDFASQEGSLFLSTDVITKSGYQFRIKATESQIKMFPDENPLFSEFMKFYEFILRFIDSKAELSL